MYRPDCHKNHIDNAIKPETGDFTPVSAKGPIRRTQFPTIRYTAFDALADVLDARCEAGVWTTVPAHIAASAMERA